MTVQKENPVSDTTADQRRRIYAIADENCCGKCGAPAYRCGFRRIHQRCTSCDYDSAKIWPNGAFSPKEFNDA